MDRLEEATNNMISAAEKRVKLATKEKQEHLRLIDELRNQILRNSQRELECLKSQIEFLKFVNQNSVSIDELEETFDKQISIVEKLLEDVKVETEGAMEKMIELQNLNRQNLEKVELESYYQFLIDWKKKAMEEKSAQIQLKNSRNQKTEALRLSLSEVNASISELQAKKEMLEECLKSDDRKLAEATVKPKIEEVEEELSGVEKMNYTNDLTKSSVEIINIDDDDSTTEDSGLSKEEKAEVSSEYSITQDVLNISSPESVSQSNVQEGKAVRKVIPQLRTKCSQTQLHNFLLGLKGEKRRVIEESMFKPFLSISPRNVGLSLTCALIERFDAKTNSFIIDNRPLKFCPKEVERCLGVRYKGRHVDFSTRAQKKTPSIIKKYFGSVKKITKEDFLTKLEDMHVDKDNSDDFFRLSVLFMFNVYFFTSTDAYISFWPLTYLVNLEAFKSYGWGRAVYEYLMESVRKMANATNTKKVSSWMYVKGCLPLLETLVYERLGTHLWEIEVDPNVTVPCIIKYTKGDNRSLSILRRVLSKLKFDQIKECEDCSEEETASV